MATEIEIRYDGEVPGLADGRISLAAFLPALNELLTALRRIGSNMIVDATGSERGHRGGRFAKGAEALDLEISSITHNCGVLTASVTARTRPGENLLLFNDLPERAARELLESIENESAGKPHQVRVREYFRKLPEGVTEQRYKVRVNGTETRTVHVKHVRPMEEELFPGLREFVATPNGAIFNPPRIQLREDDGQPRWYGATDEHVETVLKHRADIRVLVLTTPQDESRVLRLSVGAGPLPEVPEGKGRRRVFVDWKDALKRLADE